MIISGITWFGINPWIVHRKWNWKEHRINLRNKWLRDAFWSLLLWVSMWSHITGVNGVTSDLRWRKGDEILDSSLLPPMNLEWNAFHFRRHKNLMLFRKALVDESGDIIHRVYCEAVLERKTHKKSMMFALKGRFLEIFPTGIACLQKKGLLYWGRLQQNNLRHGFKLVQPPVGHSYFGLSGFFFQVSLSQLGTGAI